LVDRNGAQKSVFENCIYPYKGRKLQIILDEEIRKELVEKIPQGSKCFIVMDSRSGNATIELEHSWQKKKLLFRKKSKKFQLKWQR
jgi:hypothetical protein